MIKKLIYTAAIAAILCSCGKEIAPEILPVADGDLLGYEHDGKVTFGFNPDFGGRGTTKALVEDVDIKNLYVAVFDETGFRLSEYIKAEPFTAGTENNTKYQYTIELKVSEKPRILHFIGNAPEELRFGQENEVIGELYTSIDAADGAEGPYQNAYWQRIRLERITAKPKEGDEDYNKKLNEYNTVVEKLNNVVLIRNYSKVTAEVSPNCKNFVLDGFWFLNYPSCGSVAPYNRNTGTFVADYDKYATIEAVEDEDQGNYQGFMLASTQFRSSAAETIENNANWHAVENGKAVGYVYEREKALFSPMYLIMQGKYYPDKENRPNEFVTTYYKIAMQDTNGSFYAMLRNFNYLVLVTEVSAKGYDSAAEALNGTPSGDISVNVDYEDLPNISDGDARITVSETTLMIVAKSGSTTASFWYMYEPDIKNNQYTGVFNNVGPVEGEPFVEINYEGTSGSTGDVIQTLSVADIDEGGHRYVTITTTGVGDVPKTQTVTITGKKSDGNAYRTISRNVNLILRKSLELSVSASPNTDADGNAYVKKNAGVPVVINLEVENGLPSSMFPLEFKIEPVANSLTPDNAKSGVQSLPARYGTNDAGYPAYWFEKTVSWTEYSEADVVDGKKLLPVYFTTTIPESATQVDVSQPLFNSANVLVNNYDAKEFRNLSFSETTHKVGTEETFSFDMSETPEGGKVTVAMSGIEPASDPSLKYLYTSGGKEYYELTVSGTSVSFDVTPYAEGNVSIELSAYLFDDASKTISVTDPDRKLASTYDLSGTQKVYGNNLVPGQSGIISIYIKENLESIKVKNTTVYKSGQQTMGGETYYKYDYSYTAPSNGDNSKGFYDVLPVYNSNNDVLGSVKITVCGIVKDGNALTSASQAVYNQNEGTGWYVIENTSFNGYHLARNGTNISGRNADYDYNSIFGFSTTGGSVKVAVPSANTNSMYYCNGYYNTDISLNGTGTSYSFSGTQFSYGTRYWRQASGDGRVQSNNTTNSNRTFSVTPISFVLPE